MRPVVKIGRNGKTLESYKSVAEAVFKNCMSVGTVKYYCNLRTRRYIDGGVTFRYKEK